MNRCIVTLCLLACAAPLPADEAEELKQKNAKLEERVHRLEQKLGIAHEEEGEEQPGTPHHDSHLFEHEFEGGRARVDLHMVGLFAAGYSSVKDRFTEGLSAGGHDPKRRGFNLQQFELGFSGALEPYLSLDAYVVFTLEGVELEEAFFKTLSLPAGLQLEGGYMLTEFGWSNPRHPHEWAWLDQPVVNSRLLGPDGTRALGLRLGWLTPLPWFSELHIGMQTAIDETAVSFLGEGHLHGEEGSSESPGGFARIERDTESFNEFLYLLRWHNRAIAGEFTLDIGISGLLGSNATGDSGRTWLAGGDFLLKWRPAPEAEQPFLALQGEFMYRYYQANAGTLSGDPADPLDDITLAPTVLGDWGGYLQVLVAPVEKWAFGLRVDFADAFREGEEPRQADSLRDRRFRLSPLIQWSCCDFARVRLQYNFDHMQHLRESTAHGLWLGIEVMIGAHKH